MDVTTSTFEQDVVQRSHTVPVVVDFWADWCGPCRALGPVLEQLAEQDAGAWELVKVDTDAEPGLARRFGIQGIPAVKAFKNGKVVAEFVGALPAPRVRAWLDALSAPTPEELAAKAIADRADGADEAALTAAIDADPADLDARWALAHALAARGEHDAALGHLLEIVRRDRKYRDDGARKAMLDVFEVAGTRSPLADHWRGKLSMELFR